VTTTKLLAKNIRRIIKDGEYTTIENFCLANNIPKTNIYNILKFQVSPSIDYVGELANKLEIDVRELLKP